MPILPDKKRKKDKRLENREVKVGAILFENVFLIIMPHWPIFCISRISVNVYKKDHIEKSKRYNPGFNTIDRDRRLNNPSISISIANGGTDNLSTSIGIVDKDIRANNLSTNIGRANKKANNSSISIDIADADEEAKNLSGGIGIANKDKKADNLSISTSVANRRMNNPSISTTNINVNERANE